ncbi:signal peptidase complex subunit 1 [Pteronotus mesoamericanus]|uniref:signal peptidase complex subunit 1 n=1 Tax=Pteronotus mesoamericanus TaxID=1884717 RepID=UPI0023EC7442|nr:signal peptidase complex subunit 1 [Pteronotus parnellii mesoamericanus]
MLGYRGLWHTQGSLRSIETPGTSKLKPLGRSPRPPLPSAEGGGAAARAPARPANSAPALQAPGPSSPLGHPRSLHSGRVPPTPGAPLPRCSSTSLRPPAASREIAKAQSRTVGGGRVSQHPTALTANPSPARNVSARPPRSPPRPSRAVRRAPAGSVSAGRLAMERGGASGCPRLPETSASGAAALSLPGSVGPPGCAQGRSLNPESRSPSPRSRTPSPRSRTPAPCCPLQPVMLEHLSSLPTQMDYKGQKLAEQMFQGIILFSAIIGFIYGYVAEQFGWTVYIVMAGFAFSCLLTLPPWPIYRRHPLKWLPVQDSSTEDKKPGERKIKRHAKNN